MFKVNMQRALDFLAVYSRLKNKRIKYIEWKFNSLSQYKENQEEKNDIL